MKKIAIISVLLMTAACALFFVGCDTGGEDRVLTIYDIDAVLNMDTMTVTATETVQYVNNYDAALDSVYFHLYPAAYREGARFSPIEARHAESAYPSGISYGGITISSVTVNGAAGVYELGGEDENILMINGITLEPTKSAEIKIVFSLTLPQVRHRFGYIGRTVNLGNWYPVAAIREDGKWRTDSYYNIGDPFYSETADYSVSLVTPTGWTVAGAGRVVTTVNGDETVTEFTASNVRDFALVASGNMTMVDKTVDGTAIRYYYAADAKADYRLKLIEDALATFNNLFGKYPYPQLSVVQTNFLHGGMEYPQLVYVSNALNESLYDEAIIHEIAHQWWYAVVGNDQINEAWMDEGLAEYSTSLFYERNPSYGVEFEDRIADAMKGFVLFNEVYRVQIGDNTAMSRPLSAFFSSTDYAYHVYVKGSLMFDSLRHLIGDESFFAGLKIYYENYMYETATADGMIGAFERASKINLKVFFTNWIDGNVGLYASLNI